MPITVNSGVFAFQNFNITPLNWVPIICPYQCCYFSFWNPQDAMNLSMNLESISVLLLPQGAAQDVTATYFRADYRFNAGDILFFAQGVNQATSTAYLTTVKR